MPHGKIDLSSGSFAANMINGERWLVIEGTEAQLTNNERFWNNILEDMAIEKGFASGYEMANAYWEATSHAMAVARAKAGEPTNAADAFAALDDAIAKKDGVVILEGDEFGEDSSITDEDIEQMRAAPYVPPADDIDESAGVILEEQVEGNIQNDNDGADLDTSSDQFPINQSTQPVEPMGASALADPSYDRVVKGWNQKLEASSQDLSSLVPFCELYAVFDESDIVVKESQGSTRYTAIKDRMIQVNFKGPDGNRASVFLDMMIIKVIKVFQGFQT